MVLKKTLYSLTMFLLFVLKANAFQNEFNETSKYKQFGLVWGILKYHHPNISKGEYDWNKVFLENIKLLDNISDQNKLDHFLLNFISQLDNSKLNQSSTNAELFKKNSNYNWIKSLHFNKELKKKLIDLSKNSNISDYYTSFSKLNKIPTFENDKSYNGFNSQIKGHRILAFFSLWNVIEYFYVNKYLMNIRWYDQIDNYLPEFISCNSKLEYEKLKTKLISSINDSHAFHVSLTVNKNLFKYKPAFDVEMINDTLVITSIYNKKLGELNDILLGDLIIEVKNSDIRTSLEKRVGSMISHSNKSFLENWSRLIFFNDKDSIEVKIKRKNNILTKHIKLYDDFEVKDKYSIKKTKIKEKSKLIEDGIGYINLSTITKKEFKNSFKKFINTKGIIIDLRNYPKNITERDIAKQLYPNKKKFISVLYPIKDRPSYAKFDKAPLSFIKDPFKAGSKNSNYYKGKIILLVNQSTQSRAEFLGMAIQASPNCITIGKQTAGSVMNITTYTMPDKTKVNLTSMGAFYPNGEGVQKKGLKINYLVSETTTNFIKDQYLIKAIKLIETQE